MVKRKLNYEITILYFYLQIIYCHFRLWFYSENETIKSAIVHDRNVFLGMLLICEYSSGQNFEY